MKRKTALILGVVLIVAIMAGFTMKKATPGSGAKPAAAVKTITAIGSQKEPLYLLFWRELDQVPALSKSIGTQSDGRHLLGFGLGCYTFEMEKQVPTRIRAAFAIARKYNVAVMLHFDFHVAWQSRPDLWNWYDPTKPGYNPANKQNVEWYGWDGPASKVRYLNWGVTERMPPPMCFTSKQIRKEWTRLIRDVITPTLKQEIAALKREGKVRLFAGVLVGSEPMFDNYTKPDAEMVKMMVADGTPKGRLGYRSLMNRGYSKTNPPKNMTEALGSITQETVAFWCMLFADAGIPTAKLYPHVAPQLLEQETGAPISAAFNMWSRPGWSTYPVGVLDDGFEPLYRELKKHGNPRWAGVESNAWYPGASVDWETYLGWQYNHGAAVVAINTGATGSELPERLSKAAFSPEAITAYRKFLRGETLKETGLSAKQQGAKLKRKMQILLKAWQSSGIDHSQDAKEITERLQPLLNDGKIAEAEAVIDAAIKKLGIEAVK
ncbi:MAG: hypothetical protein ACYC1M_11315 [Armatimonadota bacterium]